jgi:hypothetical protein
MARCQGQVAVFQPGSGPQTDKHIGALSQAASRIGHVVVVLIQTIPGRTNPTQGGV